MTSTEKLVVLYQKMADLTEPKCRECRAPWSCCSSEYCDAAIEMAAERGVVLASTGHPTLPLMGPKGCVAEPHLRPMCTLHVCSINGMGFDAKDSAFTKKYFALRDEIDRHSGGGF